MSSLVQFKWVQGKYIDMANITILYMEVRGDVQRKGRVYNVQLEKQAISASLFFWILTTPAFYICDSTEWSSDT
jgi:hypothetical protein